MTFKISRNKRKNMPFPRFGTLKTVKIQICYFFSGRRKYYPPLDWCNFCPCYCSHAFDDKRRIETSMGEISIPKLPYSLCSRAVIPNQGAAAPRVPPRDIEFTTYLLMLYYIGCHRLLFLAGQGTTNFLVCYMGCIEPKKVEKHCPRGLK